MIQMVKILKTSALACSIACAGVLAGCGGVSLEGPGFEKLGLTSSKQTGDRKVPDRAPLLLPPDRVRLPEPETVQQASTAPQQNWPTDPDELRKSQASEEEKKQKKYEEEGNWDQKADIDEFEKLMDPMSRKKGIFSQDKNLDEEYRDFKDYR